MSEYRVKHQKKVAPYLRDLPHPSEDFKLFLEHCFPGSLIIKGRGEEAVTVWQRLKGKELETAKRLILDHMGYDAAYIRAASYMKDQRAVPQLRELLGQLGENFAYERMSAARPYDLTGFPGYWQYLEKELPKAGQYTKISLDQ